MCACGPREGWALGDQREGIVDAADRLTSAPLKFGIRAHGILAKLGTRPEQLLTAIEEARGVGYRRLGGLTATGKSADP